MKIKIYNIKNNFNLKSNIGVFKKAILLLGVWLAASECVNAQTTIYSTDFGTVPNVNPSNWTFTGEGTNTSTNTASSGYAGASGGAYLGEGNSTTYTSTSGNTYTISQIGVSVAKLQVSTLTYSNIAIAFGMRKSGNAYNTNATYVLEWSTDDITYNVINYTEPTAGSWGLATGAGLNLPTGANNQANLYIRWTFNRTGTGSNFKIDDFKVLSMPSLLPANIGFVTADTTVNENAGSANIYLKIANSNSVTSSVDVSISSWSNATAADYTLATTTVTFAANSASNTSQPISIQIADDVIPENSEYVILKLSNPINASLTGITQFAFYINDNDKLAPVPNNALQLNLLGSFSNGASGTNSSEIVVHDPSIQRLYIVNSIAGKLDIVNFSNPSNMSLISSINILPYGNINSVAVKNGTLALAIENVNPQDSGKVVFLDKDGVFLNQVNVGMMPDMITFNHAGTKVYTANEGEPNAAYTIDPDGSISIVNISNGVLNPTRAHITFTAYNGQEATLRTQGIRIFGLNASASQDFEPEYITISDDDSKAWLALQENNAIVELDLTTNSIVNIRSLGSKDYSNSMFGMDVSDQTKGVNIANFPVKGLYMPDAIAKYNVAGVDYIITANEGDAREYAGFSEVSRISGLNLDATKFPNPAELKNNLVLGRLNATNKIGDTDNDGDIDSIFVYGSRSFTIWNGTTGALVYDSGDDFERITSTNSYSVIFNASNTTGAPTRKNRSDDKGPEPEGVAIGTVNGITYAFIALERIGGVMVYDITNPASPVYITYVNNRSLTSSGPDLGAEGLVFIPQSQSPNGQHLVIAANEVSSTLSVFGIPGCTTPLNTVLSNSLTSSICQGDSVLLSVPVQSGVTYQWKNNSGNIANAQANSYYAKNDDRYFVELNGGTNCISTSLTTSVTVLSKPTLTVSASSSSICAGQTATLSATGSSTSYSWTAGPSAAVYTVNPATNRTYTITGTGANNCKTRSTITLTVVPLPIVTINTNDASICIGESTILLANGANTYTWTNTSSTSTSISVSPTVTTAYTLTGTTNGCSLTKVAFVNVSAEPTISVTSTNSLICVGQNAVLTASSNVSNYVWSNGQTGNVIVVSPSVTANYTVTVDNGFCSKSSVFTQSVSACTSLIESINQTDVVIYPNPFTDNVVVKTNNYNQQINYLKIYNALGALIFEKPVDVEAIEINTVEWNSGVYFIQVNTQMYKMIKH
jgi:hypothetical protein